MSFLSLGFEALGVLSFHAHGFLREWQIGQAEGIKVFTTVRWLSFFFMPFEHGFLTELTSS